MKLLRTPYQSSPSPRTAEVFLSPEEEVADSVVTRLEKSASGNLYTRAVTLENGRRYSVISAEPHDRITDDATTQTAPWLMNNRFYVQNMFHLMDLGIPSDSVSVEQNGSRPALIESARHQLAIHRHTAKIHDRNPDSLRVSSRSRGAMIGLALNGLIQVLDNDLIAPCFPDRVNVKNAGTYLRGMPRELASVVTSPRAFVGAFDLSVRGMSHHLRDIPSLVGGEAGQSLLRLPREMSGNVIVFENDPIGHAEAWEASFEAFPNVNVVKIPGRGHAGNFNSRKTDEAWRIRMDAQARTIKMGDTGLRAANSIS